MRVTVSGIEERRPTTGVFAETGGAPPNLALDEVLAEVALFAAIGGSGRPRGVRAWVEQHGPTPSDLDWRRVGNVVELSRVDEDEVMRVWTGDVPLPVSIPVRQPGLDQDAVGADWRLALEEWESLPMDVPNGPAKPVERTVYMDRFPL